MIEAYKSTIYNNPPKVVKFPPSQVEVPHFWARTKKQNQKEDLQ